MGNFIQPLYASAAMMTLSEDQQIELVFALAWSDWKCFFGANPQNTCSHASFEEGHGLFRTVLHSWIEGRKKPAK